MIENLFSSKVMFRVLAALFDKADRGLTTAEIISATGKHQANISRELEKLVAWRLVSKSQSGNQNSYRLNQESPSFAPLKALYSEYDKTNGRYFLLNEEGGVALLSLNYFTRGYTSDYGVKKGLMNAVPDIISHFRDDYAWFYFEKAPFDKCAQESLARLLTDASFVRDIIGEETVRCGERALSLFRRLRKRGFRLGRKEAMGALKDFEDIISRQISLNYVAVFDLKDQLYSKYLEKYVGQKLTGTGHKLHAVLQKLLMPEELTMTQRLRKEMLALAIAGKAGGGKRRADGLRRVWSDWLWLNFGYRGPAYDLGHFQQMLDELDQKSGAELRREASDLADYTRTVRRAKNRLYSELGVDAKHRKFIDALSLLSGLKVYRKDIAFLLIYMTYEILKPFNRTIRPDNLYYLTLDEAADLIMGRLKVSATELRRREHGCAHLAKEEKILLGREADSLVDRMAEKEESNMLTGQIRQLEGTAACLGRTGDWIHGTVKIVNVAEDMRKMEEGDILVSVATTPDILPAMKKASAIVTEHGGITCHAAIVSRELNIPCLIAVKYATKLFKDGDKVTVCPRHGYIRID